MNKLFIILFSAILFLGCCSNGQNIIVKPANNIVTKDNIIPINNTVKETPVVEDIDKKENIPVYGEVFIRKEKIDVIDNKPVKSTSEKSENIVITSNYVWNDDILNRFSLENDDLIKKYSYTPFDKYPFMPYYSVESDINDILRSSQENINVVEHNDLTFFNAFLLLIIVVFVLTGILGFYLLIRWIYKISNEL